MVHYDERTAALWRPRYRLVHFDTDRRGIFRCDFVQCFFYCLGNGTGDGVEMAERGKMGCAGVTGGEEIFAGDV